MTAREQVIAIREGAASFRCLVAGQGEPLVFFHSFEGVRGWPELLDRLASRFTVYAPLHPGSQGSEGVEVLDDPVDLALAYDDWLGALGLTSACLVGHFVGGMVALELAALCPGRARCLVLLSPMGLWLPEAPVLDVVSLPPAELHPLLWKDPESQVAKAWSAPPSTEAEQVTAQIERIQRLAAMGKFVWPLPDKGLKKRLYRISAPTLLLWGDADRINPLAYGEEFLRRIKGAELRILSGGHLFLYESPEVTALAILDFLSRH
jgi:pimeloyl-ACP methyl ester carboxylesterase